LLAASGVAPDRAATASFVIGDGARKETKLAPLSREQATGWLRTVVRDLLSEPHDYFLPWESVRDARQKGMTLAACAEELRERVESGEAPVYSVAGPIEHPELRPVLDEGRAAAIVDRRYGLVFETVEQGGSR
jgi:hypothetical protein